MSKPELKKMLGKAGERIYERARGIDEMPVIAEEIIKSIGKEHTFERDTRDPEIIFETFNKILEEIGVELLSAGLEFKKITVICRFSNFATHTKLKTFEKESADLTFLRKEAKKLLLRFIVENLNPIRLIGLRLAIFSKINNYYSLLRF